MSKLQTQITSALIAVIGQLVAFVPQFGPEKQQLISIASMVVAAVFAAVHVGHQLAGAKVTPAQLEQDAGHAVEAAVGSLDLNAIAKQVEMHGTAAIPELVRAEIGRLLGTAVSGAAVSPPDAAPAPAPVEAPAAA